MGGCGGAHKKYPATTVWLFFASLKHGKKSLFATAAWTLRDMFFARSEKGFFSSWFRLLLSIKKVNISGVDSWIAEDCKAGIEDGAICLPWPLCFGQGSFATNVVGEEAKHHSFECDCKTPRSWMGLSSRQVNDMRFCPLSEGPIERH